MQDRLIFLIGAPRSGTTLLARMMGAHSAIYQRAEPHLITPIAHLGYFGKVQKAPYDPNNVDQAIHEFVGDLPQGEADYLDRPPRVHRYDVRSDARDRARKALLPRQDA